MLRDFCATLFKSSKFNRKTPVHGAAEVIRRWESRRLFFNAVVGCTGVITCVLMVVCAFVADSTVGEPIGMPDGPLLGVFGILFYAILANVFYTAGWICELLLGAATTAKKSAAFGLKAFRVGIAFSIFVTLCPAALSWLAFAIAAAHGQKHGPPGE
jgi:hypothetical protein